MVASASNGLTASATGSRVSYSGDTDRRIPPPRRAPSTALSKKRRLCRRTPKTKGGPGAALRRYVAAEGQPLQEQTALRNVGDDRIRAAARARAWVSVSW